MVAKKATIVAIMALALVAPGAGPKSASAATEPALDPKVDTSQTKEARALEFRRTFGFDTNLDLIREAETSPAYLDRPYGVPLSVAEMDELVRRVQVEKDSTAAANFGAEQATWGGYYFDQLDRGAPVFLFTADLDAMRAEIGKLLPDGTGFRVQQVDRSLAELIETKTAIFEAYSDLRESGIDITSTGLDLMSNAVVVGIDGLTEDAVNTISSRFGKHLKFTDSAAASSDACPSTGCRQIKGGIRIVSVPAGINYACTAGFIVRRSIDDSLAVLTAGHCIWAQTTTPFGDAWYHKTTSGSNTTFGLSRYHGFHNNSYGDTGLIEIDPDESTYDNAPNKIWTDDQGVMTVVGVVLDSNQTQGSQACAFGAFSNNSFCGVINDPMETKKSKADPAWGDSSDIANYDILDTKVYTYNLIPGDSGGPIYQIASYVTYDVYALGTHVHSIEGNTTPVAQANGGWYTPFGWGRESYYQASGYTDTYYVCISSTC